MRGGAGGTRKYVGEKLSCGSYGYKNIWVLGLMSIRSIGVLELFILEHIGNRIYTPNCFFSFLKIIPLRVALEKHT